MVSFISSLVAAVLALCGMGFYLLCLRSVRTFIKDNRKPHPEFTPPVSILKPLRGVDPQMYESFRSHCVQDYREYEIIFGVHEADDPAVEAVHQLMREFPACRIRLVFCPQVLGNNRKTSNVVQMLPYARYEHILINDSDIFVTPDYLRRVMSPFAGNQVGMVTCPYRGIAAKTLGSKLESIGILLTFGLPWAMIAVALAAAAWWSWLVLAAAVILRAAVCVQVGVKVLHDSATVRRLALVPLRDLIAFWVWFASFAGHEVHWRGDVFILKDGKIRPAHHHAPVMVSAAEPEQDKVSVHS